MPETSRSTGEVSSLVLASPTVTLPSRRSSAVQAGGSRPHLRYGRRSGNHLPRDNCRAETHESPWTGGAFKPRNQCIDEEHIDCEQYSGLGGVYQASAPLGSCKPRHGKLAHRCRPCVHVPWRLPQGKVRQRRELRVQENTIKKRKHRGLGCESKGFLPLAAGSRIPAMITPVFRKTSRSSCRGVRRGQHAG